MKKLVFVLSMVISSFVVAAEAPLQESELSAVAQHEAAQAELQRRYDAAEQSRLASSRAQVHPKRSIVAVPTTERPTAARRSLW